MEAMKRRRHQVICAGVLAALALVASAAAAGTTLRGDFRFNELGSVRLIVHHDHGGDPVRVLFEAKDVKLYCEDGTVDRSNVLPTRVPVHDNKFIFGSYGSDVDSQGFLLVRGAIHGRSASGRVMLGYDASGDDPACGTRAQGRWNARAGAR
jgi:hypothetical protein